MLEKAKTTFLPSRVPVVKLKMPNLCSCAGQRTLSEAEARPAAVPQARLTCWSVTCSCSLATSCGIAERIPIGPSSDAMTWRERSCQS